jgi:hypothetical protein
MIQRDAEEAPHESAPQGSTADVVLISHESDEDVSDHVSAGFQPADSHAATFSLFPRSPPSSHHPLNHARVLIGKIDRQSLGGRFGDHPDARLGH